VTAVVAAEATGSMVNASLAMGLIRMIEAHKVAGKPCKIRHLLVPGIHGETYIQYSSLRQTPVTYSKTEPLNPLSP